MSRMLEIDEEKRAAAVAFAIDKGVLERCEFHEDCVFERDVTILDAAYRSASYEFARGMHPTFDSQRDMTDYIKRVVEDHPADECPRCEHEHMKD